MKAIIFGFEKPAKQHKEIALEAPALENSPQKGIQYRWLLLPNGFYPAYGKDSPIIQVEQQFKSGDWGACGGGWLLESLVNGDNWSNPCTSDTIAIDHGQNWYVSGIQAAMKEATAIMGAKE